MAYDHYLMNVPYRKLMRGPYVLSLRRGRRADARCSQAVAEASDQR